MSLSALQEHARRLGFEVAFRTKHDDEGGFMPDLTPPNGQGWVLAGNYEHIAGFWIKPLETTRRIEGGVARKLLADCDLLMKTVGDYGADFFDD